MSDLGPGEAYERFAADLDAARAREAATEIAVEGAQEMVSSANEFLADTEVAAKIATRDRGHVEATALSAIEAAGGGSQDRDVQEAIMKAKGMKPEEIEEYFGHIDKLNEKEQPVVVISGSLGSLGVSGLTVVTYGRSADPEQQDRFRWFGKSSELMTGKAPSPGDRHVEIITKLRRGFGIAPDEQFPDVVFAQPKGDESFDRVRANVNHPFERVHFAGSSDEVGQLTDTITGNDDRLPQDDAAIQAVGLPSMVAYGDEAVVEVTKRIADASPRENAFLVKRCLEELGIGLELRAAAAPPSPDDRMMGDFSSHLSEMFDRALDDFLSVSSDPNADPAKTLAFLGALQDSFGYYPQWVGNKIVKHTPAVYSPKNGHFVTEDRDAPGAVALQVRKPAVALEHLGVSVRDEKGDLSTEIGMIQTKALEEALKATSRIHPILRHRIKKALA